MSGDAQQTIGNMGRSSGNRCGWRCSFEAQQHEAVPCFLKELNPSGAKFFPSPPNLHSHNPPKCRIFKTQGNVTLLFYVDLLQNVKGGGAAKGNSQEGLKWRGLWNGKKEERLTLWVTLIETVPYKAFSKAEPAREQWSSCSWGLIPGVPLLSCPACTQDDFGATAQASSFSIVQILWVY